MTRWEGDIGVGITAFKTCKLAYHPMIKTWTYFFETNNIMFEPNSTVFIERCRVCDQN